MAATAIPEHLIFEACDRVLERGERPTVDRVRQELGRGSPARVGAVLDAWWDHLATRLSGERSLPGVPKSVAEAFRTIWSEACSASRLELEREFKAQQAALADERAKLEERETAVQAEAELARSLEAAANARADACELRLGDAERHAALQASQIQSMEAQLVEANAIRRELNERMHALLQQEKELRITIETVRQEASEHIRATEDRALTEIDRARHEVSQVRAELKKAQDKFSAKIDELTEQRTSMAASLAREQAGRARLEADLEGSKAQLADVSAKLAAALARATDLKAEKDRAEARAADQASAASQLQLQIEQMGERLSALLASDAGTLADRLSKLERTIAAQGPNTTGNAPG